MISSGSRSLRSWKTNRNSQIIEGPLLAMTSGRDFSESAPVAIASSFIVIVAATHPSHDPPISVIGAWGDSASSSHRVNFSITARR